MHVIVHIHCTMYYNVEIWSESLLPSIVHNTFCRLRHSYCSVHVLYCSEVSSNSTGQFACFA